MFRRLMPWPKRAFCSFRRDPSKFTLFELVQKVNRNFKIAKERVKNVTPREWLLASAGSLALWAATREKEEELYPINYFHEDVTKVPCPLEEIRVVVNFEERALNYRVRFIKDKVKYYVDYGNNGQQVKELMDKLPVTNKAKTELRTQNFHLFLEICTTLFVAAFFIRTSSIGGVNKKTKGDLSSMVGNIIESKKFEIITKSSVRFKDVAGLDESKLEVKEFVDFLKQPQKYQSLGARIPKGVLLSGPPGTGKTMLAKACAGEAGVPFIATSGSDFVEIFVGVGASRVRDLFKTARQQAPAIIFIDEIDAVGRKRSGSHGGHDERDNTLNQILVEMDGFETNCNVIVMAATNRQNLLDSALVRPGRFDRIVEVGLPDLEGRRQIFNVHLSKVKLDLSRGQDQYARRLAALTPGFSGAQIANLCNEAAILAARHNKLTINSHDFEMATQRVIGGIERKSIISTDEKRTVAVHESGHAVVSWFLQGADPLLKLTIIPRSKGALGFAQYFTDETKLHTRTQLIDRICFILGGRCAEELFFGKITTGASDDLKKAYQLAHNIVVKLGMSAEIGYVGYRDSEYLRPYSEQQADKIDHQIKRIISQCTERTRNIVKERYDHIKKQYSHFIVFLSLSDELFVKETLTIREIRRILGERDFTSNQTYEKYLQMDKQDTAATIEGKEAPIKAQVTSG